MTESDRAGERLHSANTSGNGAFTDDLEQPKLPGPQHVGTAAQFHGIPIQPPGIPSDLHHANFRPIFLAEKLHDISPGFHLSIRNFDPTYRVIGNDAAIDQLLDISHLLRRNRMTVK